MDIALLNVKVTIEKNEVVSDEIGNRRNVWREYYSCFATVSGEGGGEAAAAGLTVDASDISFSIRYCKVASFINNTEYRIAFNGEIYNILSIDYMNYKKKSLKLKCQKVRR